MSNNFKSKLRMVLLLALAIPFAGIGQKNVVTSHRVFPKVDKVLEFEKALAAHAQKYHTGDTYWRVFEIQSGPDAGGYQINEGPTSWDALDTRGDMGAEHNADWNKSVTIYLTDRMSLTYAVYQDSLSTIALGDYSDKINIGHVYPKIGQSDNVVAMIKKLKKAWTAGGITVAVYTASSSGKSQYSIVTRYKQGLKERTPGFRKPFKEIYESVNGEGSYAQYLRDAADYIDENWNELLFMRKDLGSK
ncbi:MAG: hypothetical protein IPP73_08025 [Chitinophagaceae bacterium]|nr:hypothetical protein [Chitinophagaceae bacterium]